MMRLNLRRSTGIVAVLAMLWLASCNSSATRQPMGPSTIRDTAVKVFHAGWESAWKDFRLGGGLNVVVADTLLPREPKWRSQPLSKGISSSPVVYRRLILVAANDNSLYALDGATGNVRWRYTSTNPLMTQPVYAHGVVFVASGNHGCSVCMEPDYFVGGSGDSRLCAVDIETGKELWTRSLAGSGMPTPAIVGSNVIHADGSGAVLALDARSGAFRWVVRLPSAFMMSSVVNGRDGRVYVSGTLPSAVYAIDSSSGKVVWRHPFSKYYAGVGDGPMAQTKDLLIGQYRAALSWMPHRGWLVAQNSPVAHHIFALKKSNGALVWDRVVARGVNPVRNGSAIPLVYRQRLYEGSGVAPVFSCIDVATGRLLWQIRTGSKVQGGVVALDGILYFASRGGDFWAVSAQTGHVIGRRQEETRFRVGSPIIVNDSFVVGAEDGSVVAVPLKFIRTGNDPIASEPAA